MESKLTVYNSLKRQKEVFEPLIKGHVGLYVCGPTVYKDVHLGNCRTFISFDIIYRYLMYLGYKVRYVRNITDVGHLLDDGRDRVLEEAKLEKLEPMEIVQKYTLTFHNIMSIFNGLPPSIEPRASGHIIEQIEMVEQIIKNGYGYEVNGSVYFDTMKLVEDTGDYGILSGRVVDDLIAESRELKGQQEKRHPSDFAIWMKANPEHIMRWNSPWGEGFPGWHLECSAMSTKYLGKTFDIHGGGNDLKFPHHENEIAQNYGACKCAPARYWLHTNMLLLNGKKMSKSDGNTISPEELFTGESEHISKGYSPMVIRFFMLQAHYRSTMDINDEALQAAEKGYKRLMTANEVLQQLSTSSKEAGGPLDGELNTLLDGVHAEMSDDFNTPKTLAKLFEIVPKINGMKAGHLSIAEVSEATLTRMKETFHAFIFDIFGLKAEEESGAGGNGLVDELMGLILDIRSNARANKDWPTSDKIRDGLKSMNIVVKDGKEGSSWTVE